MHQLERLEEIERYIIDNRKASVSELSQMFGTSTVTIRKDLEQLVNRGIVLKVHGGAVLNDARNREKLDRHEKYTQAVEQKKKIAKKAAELVERGDVVMIGGGTTTIEMVKYIADKEITVVTPDLRIAYEVSKSSKNTLVVSGGMLDKSSSSYTLIGANSEDFMKQVFAKKLFIGVDAIDPDYGISHGLMGEVEGIRAQMRAADEVVILADSSKFSKKFFAWVCKAEDADMIITEEMSDSLKKRFEDKGVKVVIA